jgi:hypothetical protein
LISGSFKLFGFFSPAVFSKKLYFSSRRGDVVQKGLSNSEMTEEK